MGLTKYREKRNFNESPEPTGGKPCNEKLRFVIQKHDASHLHYDFRLEMEGVLKSWAVPKGPSTDITVKRLAMLVEDHPYDYRTFEGIIPSGYGTGTVIVWDEGYYEPSDIKLKTKKEQDKELRKQLSKGKLKIILHGKKLKGEYALVKAHGRGENGWLLIKLEDKYASEKDITLKEKSVMSNKTLAQVEKTTTNFYGSKRAKESISKSKKETSLNERKDVRLASEKNAKEKFVGNTVKAKNESAKIKNIDMYLSKTRKIKFPATLKPMLATLVDKPFEQEGWMYEIKWDGYRAVAFINNGKVELKSRNDKSFNKKFYAVYDALLKWDINAIVDGEIVVLDDNGKSNFGALQNWRSEADGELLFYAFDVIWLEGKDLTKLTFRERREILKSIMPDNEIIRLSEAVEESGIEFFNAAKKMGLEGIIAKKADSIYTSDNRSTEWLKIKANKRQEMVIGGFTNNDDSSKAFSSLLLGVFEKGHLIYTGKVGTGFNDKTQMEMMKQFKSFITKKNPFTELPDINKPSRFRPNPPHATATFLKPELVCEVSYTEMTTDGIMRHPSFEGIRIDKKAKDVKQETEKPTKKTLKQTESLLQKKIIMPTGKKERKTFLNPTDETQVRSINGHELKFSNLSKIYWPKEKITKRDMLNYYYQVAPYILPYLKDRPQSMNRHPDGIKGESFFLKT